MLLPRRRGMAITIELRADVPYVLEPVGAENVIRQPRTGFSRNRRVSTSPCQNLFSWFSPGQHEDGDLAIEVAVLRHDVSRAPSSRMRRRK